MKKVKLNDSFWLRVHNNSVVAFLCGVQPSNFVLINSRDFFIASLPVNNEISLSDLRDVARNNSINTVIMVTGRNSIRIEEIGKEIIINTIRKEGLPKGLYIRRLINNPLWEESEMAKSVFISWIQQNIQMEPLDELLTLL